MPAELPARLHGGREAGPGQHARRARGGAQAGALVITAACAWGPPCRWRVLKGGLPGRAARGRVPYLFPRQRVRHAPHASASPAASTQCAPRAGEHGGWHSLRCQRRRRRRGRQRDELLAGLPAAVPAHLPGPRGGHARLLPRREGAPVARAHAASWRWSSSSVFSTNCRSQATRAASAA